MDETSDPVMRLVEEAAKSPPLTEAERKEGFYSPAGDCVFFCLEGAGLHGESVDRVLSLYTPEDGRIVGGRISGIRQLRELNPMFARCLNDGPVDAVTLLLHTFYTYYRKKLGSGEPIPQGVEEKYAEVCRVLRGCFVPLRAEDLSPE